MLTAIAPNLWHIQHPIKFAGLGITTRMTVVRLSQDRLWLHSPVPLDSALAAQLAAIGTVAYVVAPSKTHHLFMGDYLAAYRGAEFYCAPGLQEKRPDLGPLNLLSDRAETGWAEDFDQLLFRGLPMFNEVVWFHRPSRTLILTDLCQWMAGELSFGTALFARLTGVKRKLAMPRTLKMLVKDKQAARASCDRILAWPFERVIVAHDTIIEAGARAAVKDAFAWLN